MKLSGRGEKIQSGLGSEVTIGENTDERRPSLVSSRVRRGEAERGGVEVSCRRWQRQRRVPS